MRRVGLVFLIAGCFNFDSDFESYCQRHPGVCDGGSATAGGGDARAGGSATAGGSAQGGGAATAGGSAVGGGSGFAGGSGGGTATAGGGTAGGMVVLPDGGCPMACPNVSLGTGFCDAGVCDIRCSISSYHYCGGAACVPNNQSSCGPSCITCMPPPNSTAFCDGGQSCDFNCQSGFARDGGGCVAPPLMSFPNIGDITDPNTFIDARIDPNAAGSILWALTFGGQVVTSNDLGMSFSPVCRLPNTGLDSVWSGFALRTSTRLHLSPAADATAYVTTPSSKIYRAEAASGTGFCTDVTPTNPSPGTIAMNGVGAGFTIDPGGTLYALDGDSSTQSGRLRRSTDRGGTWLSLADAGGFVAGGGSTPSGNLSAGPDGLLLAVNNGTTAATGLYVVFDGGTVVQKVSGGIWSSSGETMPRFSRAHAGYAYATRGQASNEGYYSMNGGQSWVQSPSHYAVGDWALDAVTGAGYRFSIYDGGLNLERAADMRTPAWGRVPGGFFVGQGAQQQYDRVDAVGTTVVAVVGTRLFVSTDTGQTFRRAGALPPIVTVGATLDGVDSRVFLVTAQGNTFQAYESLNGGVTFALKTATTLPGLTYVGGNPLFVVKANPSLPANAIAYHHNPNGSVYNNTMFYTLDAFTSATQTSSMLSSNWSQTFSFAPAQASNSYFYAQSGSSSQSINFGASYSTYAYTSLDGGNLAFVWYPSSVTMGNGTYGLVMECNFTNRSFKTVNTGTTKYSFEVTALMSNALGNETACAAETYLNAGVWRVRAISRGGWLAVSDDEATTFTPVPGATGGLSSCDRKITSPASDRNTVITWCGGQIWFSRTGGTSWTPVGLNWTRYGCNQITSLYAVDSKLLVTCSDRPPVIIEI